MNLVIEQDLIFDGTTISHKITTRNASFLKKFDAQKEYRWIKFSPAIATGETIFYGSIAEKISHYKVLVNPLNSMDAEAEDWIGLLLQRFDTPNCNELFTSHHRGDGWINDAKGGKIKTKKGFYAFCDVYFNIETAIQLGYSKI